MSKSVSQAVTPQAPSVKTMSLGATTPQAGALPLLSTDPSRAVTAETNVRKDNNISRPQTQPNGTIVSSAVSTAAVENNNNDLPENTPVTIWQQCVETCVAFCFPHAPVGPARRSVAEGTTLKRLTVYAKYGPGRMQPSSQRTPLSTGTSTNRPEVLLRGALRDRDLQPYELHQLLEEEERSFLCEVYCPGVSRDAEHYSAKSMRDAGLHANRTLGISGLNPSGGTLQGTIAASFATYNRSNKNATVGANTLLGSYSGGGNASLNHTMSANDGGSLGNSSKKKSGMSLGATLRTGASVGTALLGTNSSRVAAVRSLMAPNAASMALPDEVYGHLLKKKDPLFDVASKFTKEEIIGLLDAASCEALDPAVLHSTLRALERKVEASTTLQRGGGGAGGSHEGGSSNASSGNVQPFSANHFAVLFQSVVPETAQTVLQKMFFDAISEKILTERQRRISVLRSANPTAAALRSDPRVVCRNTAFLYNAPSIKCKEISHFDSPTDILNALHRYATQIMEIPTEMPVNPHASSNGGKQNAAEVMENLKCLRAEYVPDRSKPGWDGTCCLKGRDGRLNPLLRANRKAFN